MLNEYYSSLSKLKKYSHDNNYSGYDPYDALNSKFLKNVNNKLLKLLATQIFVYSPFNFRNFFNIKKEKNPKAIGLFLSSYCKQYKYRFINKDDFNYISSEFVKYLEKYKSEGYSGYCWGFNFDWQDITRFSKKWLPTIVITSYIGQSFLDLYDISKEKKFLQISNSICSFIIKDLNITQTERGICFSYTPIDNKIVHNANCLGAAFLSRVYNITKEKKLLDYSKKAFDFTLSFQKNDGSWAYDHDYTTNKDRNQIDFHQGFILDSILHFIKYSKINDEKYIQSLLKGYEFYITHQFENFEHSKWRLPLRYPIDIHHQAQGIITSSNMYEYFKEKKYIDIAKNIANWTIKYMQDKNGFFYYQKWPFFINKISYIRWNQAWMMLALSSLLFYKKEEC